MPRDTPSDDVAHIVDAVNRLADEQYTANLIAYAALPQLGKTDQGRATRAARARLVTDLTPGDPRD